MALPPVPYRFSTVSQVSTNRQSRPRSIPPELLTGERPKSWWRKSAAPAYAIDEYLEDAWTIPSSHNNNVNKQLGFNLARNSHITEESSSDDSVDRAKQQYRGSSSSSGSEIIPSTKPEPQEGSPPDQPKKGWRFWIIFVSLSISSLIVAVDQSIISTALPTIAADLNSQDLFVWVANAFILSMTVSQPIFGQMANIWGRRTLTIVTVFIFMIGSAVAGAANNTWTLILGRTIQGIGAGGIITMSEIIVCDLVPLRERGQYTGFIAGAYAVGTCLGPVLGGLFTDHTTWRWVFFINLPICFGALVLIIPFLNLKYKRVGTMWDRVKRIDWIGSFFLIGAVTSILLALAWAGTKHPWASWQTILPLGLGALGLVLFGVLQNVPRLVPEPTMPPRLFSNRTSNAIYVMAFFHGLMLLYVTYFIPLYFQAILHSSPLRSGVQVFPIVTTIAPAAVVTGLMVTKTGKYRAFHWAGWALMTAGSGSMASLDASSGDGSWIGFQLLFGLGNGMVFNSMTQPLLAALPPEDVATATATWTFMRSFGSIWGVAIPSAIFNSRMDTLVSEKLAAFPQIAAQLLGGQAYQRGTAEFMESLPGNVMPLVRSLYIDAMQLVWYVSIPFAAIGLPLCLLVKAYDLSTELANDDWGLEVRETKTAQQDQAV